LISLPTSEPVTRHTREFVRCFWALDRNLAYSRHYPAINWLTSYSDYSEDLRDWFQENIGESWHTMRDQAMALLGEDDRLQQVIKLVGEDVLPDEHKLIVEVGRLIKIGFLQQNSFSSRVMSRISKISIQSPETTHKFSGVASNRFRKISTWRRNSSNNSNRTFFAS